MVQILSWQLQPQYYRAFVFGWHRKSEFEQEQSKIHQNRNRNNENNCIITIIRINSYKNENV